MKLHYKEYGKGMPVIILHGLLGLSDNWVSLGKKLSNLFHVIIPDLRNHGQSMHSPEHDFRVMSEDIYELINDLNLNNPVIIGHSMGGKTAMHFAMRFQEMIKALVIVDIAPDTYLDEDTLHAFENVLDTILQIDLSEYSSRKEIEQSLEQKESSEVLRQLLNKNIQRNKNKKFEWRVNAEVLRRQLPEINTSLKDSLGKDYAGPCLCPALFIRGENSNFINSQNIESINYFFSHATIETILNAGHLIHVDQPQAFYEVLVPFLEQVSIAKGRN